MKKNIFLLAVLFMASVNLSAQADKIVGFWLTEDGESQIQIFRGNDGTFHARISWLEELYENGKPKVDDENPNPELRNRPILGLEIMEGLVYDSQEKEWKNGTIYDPDSGKTYSCFMWFQEDPSTLYLKGYVMGMRFLGRSSLWKRENDRNL